MQHAPTMLALALVMNDVDCSMWQSFHGAPSDACACSPELIRLLRRFWPALAAAA
jgi:hypothetical protein